MQREYEDNGRFMSVDSNLPAEKNVVSAIKFSDWELELIWISDTPIRKHLERLAIFWDIKFVSFFIE
jgi:hypothetical protein